VGLWVGFLVGDVGLAVGSATGITVSARAKSDKWSVVNKKCNPQYAQGTGLSSYAVSNTITVAVRVQLVTMSPQYAVASASVIFHIKP
jgi:hypothetical protein